MLAGVRFAPLFVAGSRAEIAIAGDGRTADRRQVDRLVGDDGRGADRRLQGHPIRQAPLKSGQAMDRYRDYVKQRPLQRRLGAAGSIQTAGSCRHRLDR